jgi:hypothetical protein
MQGGVGVYGLVGWLVGWTDMVSRDPSLMKSRDVWRRNSCIKRGVYMHVIKPNVIYVIYT